MSSIGSYLESVFSLEGKIILMTGAAGGLGAAMAEALAKAGGTVLIGDLDRSPAKELAQKMRDEGLKAKAYDLMLYLFAALMVAFSLIPDTPLPVILLMVAGYLLVVAFQIYWLVRLNKEM